MPAAASDCRLRRGQISAIEAQVSASGRDLDRPPASRQKVCAQRRRLRRRRPGGNEPSNRTSRRTGSGPTAGSSGHLRSRPSQYAPQARVRRGRFPTVGRHRARPSSIYGRRARLGHLSPTRHARVGAVRHDRRWSWFPTGALAAGAGAEVGSAGLRHVNPWRGDRLELPAQARAWPVVTSSEIEAASADATPAPRASICTFDGVMPSRPPRTARRDRHAQHVDDYACTPRFAIRNMSLSVIIMVGLSRVPPYPQPYLLASAPRSARMGQSARLSPRQEFTN